MKRLMMIAMMFMNVAFASAGRTGPLLGACQDDHGCNQCAGYSWCEGTQECHRPWEVNCLNLETTHDN